MFDNRLDESHGFKLLEQCNPDDYDGCIPPGGSTALYDATENGITATTDYAKLLVDNDFSVNAIVFIITDGCDNASTLSPNQVKKALSAALKTESLESIITVLVGVGMSDDPAIQPILDDFHQL